MEINTTKISRIGSNSKIPIVLCLDHHNNISPEEAGCVASKTVNKNSKFSIGLDK